jgi:hypothetical protein
MHHYDAGVSLVNRGRVIPVVLPTPFESSYSVFAVGWVVDEASR